MLVKADNQNSCVYCNEINSNVLYPTFDIFGNNFFINKCKSCNAYFLAPTPSEDMLKAAYDDSYYGKSETKFSSPLVEKVLDYFRNSRAKKLSRLILPNSTVIDIGCGNGRFLKYLSSHKNAKLYGVEFAGNSANRAKKIEEINLKIGTLNSTDFSDNFFDAVTLFHVFEHLNNPKETISIISRILKPNGILIMSFPNIASFQSRMFKGKWLHLDPPRHLFYFAPKDFIELMKSNGFELLSEKYFSMEQNPYGMVQSILNCLQSKREVLFESLKGNNAYLKDVSQASLIAQKVFFAFTMPFFILTDLVASKFKKSATVEFIFKKV